MTHPVFFDPDTVHCTEYNMNCTVPGIWVWRMMVFSAHVFGARRRGDPDPSRYARYNGILFDYLQTMYCLNFETKNSDVKLYPSNTTGTCPVRFIFSWTDQFKFKGPGPGLGVPVSLWEPWYPYLSEVRAPPIFKVRIILLRLVTVSDETNNAKDHIIQWTASVPSVYFFFARAVSEGTPRIPPSQTRGPWDPMGSTR